MIPRVKSAQRRCFLVIVRCHAREHRIEDFNGFKNKRPFVEHYALSLLRHRRVANLRTRGKAFLCERFQDLGSPNDWNVCRLAQPENLLLQLRHAKVTDLDSKIATGDHHTEWPSTRRAHDDFRKIAHSSRGLDLCNDAEFLFAFETGAARIQFAQYHTSVLGSLDERES